MTRTRPIRTTSLATALSLALATTASVAHAAPLGPADVAARAEAHSPRVAAAGETRARVEVADDRAREAFYPRVQLSARYTRLGPTDGASFSIPTPGGVVPVEIPGPLADQWAVGAQVALPLSDWALRRPAALAAVDEGRGAADAGVVISRRAAQLAALERYYMLGRAELGLAVARAAADLARDALHVLERRVAAQVASVAEQKVAEARVADAELGVARAEHGVELSRRALQVALGDAPDAVYELDASSWADVPAAPPALAVLVERALGARVELRALGAASAQLAAEARLARAGSWPRLDLVGNAQLANPNPRGLPQEEDATFVWDVSAVVSWSWNDHLVAGSGVADARARQAALAADVRAAREGIELEVTAAWHALRDARAALVASGPRLVAAEEAYRVRRKLFELGQASPLELAEAETLLVMARTAEVDARVDARLAMVRLAYAVGAPLTDTLVGG